MACHVLYHLKAEGILCRVVYNTCRLYRSLGYKLILNHVIQSVVRMASYKTRLQSEKEIQRMLEKIGSDGDDDVSSDSDKSSESESE